MAKFEVGEIAILITGMGGVEECEIISLPYAHKILCCDESLYIVDTPNDKNINHKTGFWLINEAKLRKKKRPKEELSTWAEIQKLTDWNPKKVTA